MAKILSEFQTPVYGNDPTELLKHRWLYKGGIALLCGPTGIGKSSFLLQAVMHWNVGKPFFGIEPGDTFQPTGMRVLLAQSENDDGDIAEMRDGVISGCDDLTGEEKLRACNNVFVATIADKVADAFIVQLDAIIAGQGPFNLVVIDPAFAYLGGDSNSQRDVSHFMRELLNAFAQRYGVGVILAHHTNKPLRGKEKDNWTAGDYA